MRMRILKRLELFSKLISTILLTYTRLYPKYVVASLMSLTPLRPKPTAAIEPISDDKDDEFEDDDDDFFLEQSKSRTDKLTYRKLCVESELHATSLQRLVLANLAERATQTFETSMANYQFRFLTFVLFLFNLVCFLVQEFSWPRTLVFVGFQTLLINLPFCIYFLNLLQYYKMRYFILFYSIFKKGFQINKG